MTFLGKEWLGVTGLGSSACKIPSCFQSGSAELAPALICGGGSNPSDLRRRLGSAEPHLPHQIPNLLPALAADRPYCLSGYGGGPDRCVVKVPDIVPGKIPKPASISEKMTKSMASQEAKKVSYKVDVLDRKVGDLEKQVSGLQDRMNRVEILVQRLVNPQARVVEPRNMQDRAQSGKLEMVVTRRIEDLRQSNLESIQGIQLMRTPEGNFKFPSTGPSVVVTGWGEDPLPRSSLASSTWDHQNPSHEPALVRQWPQNPKEYLSQPQSQYQVKQWNPNPSKEKVLSAPTVNADVPSFINMKLEQMEQTEVKAKSCTGDDNNVNCEDDNMSLGNESDQDDDFPDTEVRPSETDHVKDLDILKVDAPTYLLKPINVGLSSALRVGQQCLSIENPFGFDHTLTVGVISDLNRDNFSKAGVTSEDGAHFHMKQGVVLYNLEAQMLPKSHHCYFIRLTLEYCKFSSLDSYEFPACKFNNPKHRHYVILSKNINSASVVMNSTVSGSKKYFNDKSVPAIERKIKKLMPMDDESRRLTDWMEKSVYDALQKKYLKTLLFCICEKEEGLMIEEYSFTCSYPNTSGEEVAMNFSRTGSKENGTTFKSNAAEVTSNQLRSSACQMIRTLFSLMRTLDQMPEELTAQVREWICSRDIGTVNVSDVLSNFPDITMEMVIMKRLLKDGLVSRASKDGYAVNKITNPRTPHIKKELIIQNASPTEGTKNDNGDLEHLLELNLSKNHFKGSVSAEFGNLRSIQVIDILNNILFGYFHEELGQLQNLDSLIINNNNLVGEITAQLANCFSSSTLKLSYNNFSGYVPLIKNFSVFPGVGCDQDVQRFLKFTASINEAAIDYKMDGLDEKLLRLIANSSRAVLSSMADMLGGIVGQEVMKACPGKFHPHYQFYVGSVESLSVEPLESGDLKPKNIRYVAQISAFGLKLRKKLEQAKIVMVGSGTLGCEFLKNLALMGISCSPDGKLTVTDDDFIEKSNLSRQFLFCDWNSGQPKSNVAATVVMAINFKLHVEALQNRASPETENVFNDAFWESLDVVINAFGNVNARMYIDSRCVYFQKPLPESGILGANCNTYMVIPLLTKNYGASRDPPEKQTPMCTVHSFPHNVDYCLTWARSEFEGLLEKTPTKVSASLSNLTEYAAASRTAGDAQARDQLERVIECLHREKLEIFQDCITWTRLKFEDYFSSLVKQLTFTFPEDSTISSGVPFWSAPKRFPRPLKFTFTDPETKEAG